MPSPDYERLAFEAALRGLDKQERLLEELRARTGVLLGASSLAAAFLGQQAFSRSPPHRTGDRRLGGIRALDNRQPLRPPAEASLIFAESGAGLNEALYAVRDDLGEVYRRLAYDLDRFWESNDAKMIWLTRAYGLAALALVIEILALAAILSGSIF